MLAGLFYRQLSRAYSTAAVAIHPFKRKVRSPKRRNDWLHPKRNPSVSPYRYIGKSFNPKQYWPYMVNYGGLPAGRMENEGGRYVLLWERLPSFVVPDLDGFELKPYVEEEDPQLGPRD